MNLALHLDYAAERFPGHEALVDGDVRLTYRNLREQAARTAGALEQLGLARGAAGDMMLERGPAIGRQVAFEKPGQVGAVHR